MRDPNRIPGVLAAIEEIWRKHPDLRLGQLVVIASGMKEPCPGVFYLEDEALVAGAVAYDSYSRIEKGDA